MLIPNRFNGYRADGGRTYHKGGDGGLKEQQKMEAERQRRINDAVNMINGIFDGTSATAVGGRLDEAKRVASKGMDHNGNRTNTFSYDIGAFDPNRTYYLADGTEWRAPTLTRTVTTNSNRRDDGEGLRLGGTKSKTQTITEIDQNAVAQALKQGLYTEKNVYNPSGASRQALYDEQRKAVTDLNRQDVDKQYQQTERQARFGLARSGLLGGSEEVDVTHDLKEHHDKGVLQAAALGESAAADLKMKDEQARQNLINQAQDGTQTGVAQKMALEQLSAAAQQAKGDRSAATIGDMFGDISKAYMLGQVRQGMQDGRNAYRSQSSGVSSPRTSYGGVTNNS